MILLIGYENEDDILQDNEILESEDSSDYFTLFLSDKNTLQEAIEDFIKKLGDGVDEYETFENAMDNVTRFTKVIAYQTNEIIDINLESFMKKAKTIMKEKILISDEEEEKELYLKLKSKWEGKL